MSTYSDFTPGLGLPYVLSNQAQKHVTVNESLRALDRLVQLAVLDRDLTAPPSSPSEGACFLIAANASGEWISHEGDIAAWMDGFWHYYTPQTGWRLWLIDEAIFLVFDGTQWAEISGTGEIGDELRDLERLGVGTSADASNPFSAKLNSALWTSKNSSEGGTGDLRYSLNKEASANVLSLLFQSGFSGRAEVGLIGDEDFLFKVSPDGATFYEGLRIDKATGRVDFPNEATLGSDDIIRVARSNVDIIVAPDLASRAVGDWPSVGAVGVQEAIDELGKYVFAGSALGRVRVRDGVYGFTDTIVNRHVQFDRIELRALAAINPPLYSDYSKVKADDLAEVEANWGVRFEFDNRLAISCGAGQGFGKIEHIAFIQTNATASQNGIFISDGGLVNIQKCCLFNYRIGMQLDDGGRLVCDSGLHVLYNGTAGISASDNSFVSLTSIHNSDVIIGFSGNYGAFISNGTSLVLAGGTLTASGDIYIEGTAIYGVTATTNCFVSMAGIRFKDPGSIGVLVTNGTISSMTNCIIEGNSSSAVSVEQMSALSVSALTVDAGGTTPQKTVKANFMGYVNEIGPHVNDPVFAPASGNEGNNNSYTR